MNYIYNKYKLSFNNTGYIIGCMSVDKDYDWIGQPAEVEKNNDGIEFGYGCYKLVNGNIVFDKNEYDRLKAIEEEQNKINEYKAYLNDTDWVNAKLKDLELEAQAQGKTEEEIAEMKKEYFEKYADLYAQRKVARAYIDEHQE